MAFDSIEGEIPADQLTQFNERMERVGQLDAELADEWWFVADYEIGDLFDDDPDTLWQRIVRRQPFPLNLMATFPDDPSLN